MDKTIIIIVLVAFLMMLIAAVGFTAFVFIQLF